MTSYSDKLRCQVGLALEFHPYALECQGTLALDYPSEVFRYKTIRIMEYGIQITHKHRDLFQAD